MTNFGEKMRYWLYTIINSVFFYLVLPFYFIERVIHKKSQGWVKKFGFCDTIDSNVIMLHGCSVGEILAIENLIQKIKENFPDYKLVLTTSTITGQNIALKKYSTIADYITYFPFDSKFEVSRFLDRINPKLVYIVETEIWPCFALECKRRNIPLSIINGRISDSAFKRYKLMKFYFKGVFDCYRSILTQSEEDLKRFIKIGASPDKVRFMGNLKFDIKRKDLSIDINQNGYKILTAGSTHEKESLDMVWVYEKLKKEIKNLKLILAPRYPSEAEAIQRECEKFSIKSALRSGNGVFSDEIDVVILDTLGELGMMYSICDIAYIGGSLSQRGGHNPLEATIWSKPVVSGNNVKNFRDIYDILTKANAAKIVSNRQELFDVLRDILSNDKLYNDMVQSCAPVFEAQKHAGDLVIEDLRSML